MIIIIFKSIAYSTRQICRKSSNEWWRKEHAQLIIGFQMRCTRIINFWWKCILYSHNAIVKKSYSIMNIAYIIKTDRQLIASGHGVNSLPDISLHYPYRQNKLLSSIQIILESTSTHSPSAVNSPRVIWKTLPKVCKTRTIPTNTSSVLEPAISDIHWGRCPQFLLLGRRQRKCKIKTNSVWSVAEHSALLHSVCRARCWSYCLIAPEMRGHALPITSFLETPDQNKSLQRSR